MSRFVFTVLLTALFAVTISAQKSKPWTEWSKKDAERMLNESPWGQTQTDTNTAAMFPSPTSQSGLYPGQRRTQSSTSGMSQHQSDRNSDRVSEGAYNTDVSIQYRVR